jgi:UDP-N-acetylglucosamine diphosphorylase/glucosamine-1-phosphate N-acetyltransferase
MEKHVILFDDSRWEHLLPLTYTRPVALIRLGILTIKEKWEKILKVHCYFHTKDYLSEKFPLPKNNAPCLLINGGVLPDETLVKKIQSLTIGNALAYKSTLVAAYLPSLPDSSFLPDPEVFPNTQELSDEPLAIFHPWDIFTLNGKALEKDFELITRGKKSQPLSPTNNVLNPERVFVEEGAKLECATLNAQTGPIYIGANAEVMEGSLVRGPFAICEGSTLKLGAKIYGPTTIGPSCKVGGEVNNSIFFSNSNKAHDGFLGNSVIGEWCNIGADSNNSNLKNNYAEVKLWCYAKQSFVNTGLQFCGLIMGDHSKCGINTMFNTGTVVGVSANIFGDGFPRNFIPCFSWGGAQGYTTYKLDKAIETAQKVMERRGIELDEKEINILSKVFELSAYFRRF